MLATREYQAWLVDLDGTLYWAPGVKLCMGFEMLFGGLRSLKRIRRFRREHELLRADEATGEGDPFATQVERTARALGVDVLDLERDVRAWMIDRPSRYLPWFRRSRLLREIRLFRAGGGRTALVSDYPARDKLHALRVDDLFEAVVAAGEPHGPQRLKPDPDGYLRAAQALGVPPDRCLVIGDRDDADGAAARAAGMGFRRV